MILNLNCVTLGKKKKKERKQAKKKLFVLELTFKDYPQNGPKEDGDACVLPLIFIFFFKQTGGAAKGAM